MGNYTLIMTLDKRPARQVDALRIHTLPLGESAGSPGSGCILPSVSILNTTEGPHRAAIVSDLSTARGGNAGSQR